MHDGWRRRRMLRQFLPGCKAEHHHLQPAVLIECATDCTVFRNSNLLRQIKKRCGIHTISGLTATSEIAIK
jgi:hypothetical protein